MAEDTSVPPSPEEGGYLVELFLALQPMGGYTVDGISVCGARNVPPSEPSIRRVLQWATEAGADPRALYEKAVAAYEQLDGDRRRDHPEWTWPAPLFEAVAPATWPRLRPEVQRAVHESRVLMALYTRDQEPQRIERLRQALAWAKGRGVSPEALYRDAVTHYVAASSESSRPSAPPYEAVKPAEALGGGQPSNAKARALVVGDDVIG
jgi:hypothetical protein